jgi:hypothetical protein
MTRASQSILVAMMVAVLAGCGPSAKETQVIKELSSNMTTICLGRFMMDVPRDMKAAGEVTLYYGLGTDHEVVEVAIEALDTTPAQMKTTLAKRATEIDRDSNWETKKSMLLEHRTINDSSIYLRYQSALESGIGQRHELHLLFGTAQVMLSAKSYEGLPDDPGDPTEPTEKVETRLFNVARQIRAYDDPTKVGPGFCLGPVVIDSDQDEELGDLYLRTDKYRDLLITIYSKGLTPDQPDQQLAKRVSITDGHSDIRVLRNAGTTLGGMKAHEWLAEVTDDHDSKLLVFAAESMRPSPALDRPYLNIILNAGRQLTSGPDDGKYISSSLTPREGTALWDMMIRSFRVRPDAVNPIADQTATQR